MNFKWLFLFVFAFVIFVPAFASADVTSCVTPAEKVACQAALDQVTKELAAAQAQLDDAQSQSTSISRDINVLSAQIKAAQLKIEQENLIIRNLGQDISQKIQTINTLQGEIDQAHKTLSEILVKIYETGNVDIPELLLSERSLSQAMSVFDNFQSIQKALAVTFDQLRSNKTDNQNQKDQLTTQQNKEEDARAVIQQQQATIKSAQTQKQQLLAVSKMNESSYGQLVAQKQQKAAQIRAALFNLAGTGAIPFGDALAYANTVHNATGVPPAFLLAILTQETGIGKNVGTCYLTNPGDGSGINTKTGYVVGNVMKPSRDVQPFLTITSAIGLDYKTEPVSCPQSIGYGGGMGPAQFIASTWMLLKNRIASALGISGMPNPWNPSSAFMAAGIYLSDLGAGSSSYTAQKNAACKYYSGRSCGYVSGATAYGNSVMALANSIQVNQINPLQGL